MTTRQTRTLRVLYILGTGHCGSTILSFALDTHPEIVCLGEAKPNVQIQRRGPSEFACSCGESVRDCSLWQRIFERVQQDGFRFSADDWSNDYRYRNRLLNRAFETRLALRFDPWASRVPGHRWRNHRIDRVNVSLIRAALELRGAEVFADASKRPSRLVRLLNIGALDVKVLHLIRDVRAFVASHKRRGLSTAETAVWWKRTQQFATRLKSDLPSDRFLPMKYEDFGNDPQGCLDQISSFLGLSSASLPDMIEPKGHHILGNRIRLGGAMKISADEKWRKELSENDVREAMQLAGDVNNGFGYTATP